VDVAALILGIVGIFISLLIYHRQTKSQKQIDDFVKDALTQLKTYEQTAFNLLVSLRNENLRIFMKQFDEDKNGYWHFKWRFESWDVLGLSVKLTESSECYIRVRILGTTDDFRANTYENSAYEYFLCDVIDSNNNSEFSVGERVACFYFNDCKYISKSVGRIVEPETKLKFSIVGLGNIRSGSGGDVPAIECSFSSRVKDFKI